MPFSKLRGVPLYNLMPFSKLRGVPIYNIMHSVPYGHARQYPYHSIAAADEYE